MASQGHRISNKTEFAKTRWTGPVAKSATPPTSDNRCYVKLDISKSLGRRRAIRETSNYVRLTKLIPAIGPPKPAAMATLRRTCRMVHDCFRMTFSIGIGRVVRTFGGTIPF